MRRENCKICILSCEQILDFIMLFSLNHSNRFSFYNGKNAKLLEGWISHLCLFSCSSFFFLSSNSASSYQSHSCVCHIVKVDFFGGKCQYRSFNAVIWQLSILTLVMLFAFYDLKLSCQLAMVITSLLSQHYFSMNHLLIRCWKLVCVYINIYIQSASFCMKICYELAKSLLHLPALCF